MWSKLFKPAFAMTLLFMSLALAFNPSNLHSGTALAQEDCSWWSEFGKCVSLSVKEAFGDIDLRRTTLDFTNTMAAEVPAFALSGLSADQLSCCYFLRAQENALLPTPPGASCGDPELGTQQLVESRNLCAVLDANPLAEQAGIMEPVKLSGGPAGSLMGFVVHTQEMTAADKFPTNLAYYGRHVMRKIPILGDTAYAQEVDTSNLFGVSLVLKLWELTRSVAFGLMAVFMLIIGVMIMMRKSIDPRTAVTVQNALPRVVISLILITFSYAIGALMIALISPLNSVALQPLRMVESPFGLLLTFVALIWGTAGGGGMIFITALLYLGAIIVLVIELLIILFKTIVVYVKLLILLVVAPLQFAWGAIPGNEDTIKNWFKAALVNVAAIPAMTAVLSFGLYFGWTYLIEAAGALSGGTIPSESGATGFGGASIEIITGFFNGFSNITTLIVPIAMAIIFMQASTIPKKIEEAVMGRKR